MGDKVETFGQWLKVARESRGIKSQQGLADLLGLTQETVHKWEAGKAFPTDTNVKKLAVVLCVEEEAIHEALGRVDRNKSWSPKVTTLADAIESLPEHLQRVAEETVQALREIVEQTPKTK